MKGRVVHFVVSLVLFGMDVVGLNGSKCACILDLWGDEVSWSCAPSA